MANETRFFIDISYNGTPYHGWQKQPNAETIQEIIETKLSLLLQKKITIYGSGRTDTGVHAIKQVAHVDLASDININKLHYSLNRVLPFSISINKVYKVKDDAHARFDALSRTYKYFLAKQKDPFDTNKLLIDRHLNLDLLECYSKIIFNTDSFESFTKTKSDNTNYKCLVNDVCWQKKGDIYVFTITANRFLRGMVRGIVGTMLFFEKRGCAPEMFKKLIEGKKKSSTKFADAKGLFLYDVGYGQNIF